MSSKLNTLDHTVMALLFRVGAVNLADITRMTKTPKDRASKSVQKLMELNFVSRRVDDGDLSLFSAVLDSQYFPPVHCVSARDFLPWNDRELAELVADVDARIAAGVI